MRIFSIVVKWIKLKYYKLTSPKYKAIAVKEYPNVIQHRNIYVVSDGAVPDTIIFKCPCGCNADIYLNLLKDTRPSWSFIIDKKGKITISPSIWRKINCKSHFFLRKGKIIWV